MNNKPVAWTHHCLKSGIGYLSYTKPAPLDDYKPIPLYTHPAKDKPHPKCDEACMCLCQMRKLTDEEIIELGDKHLVLVNEYIGCGDYVSNIEGEIEFARAILRKAQEK
jgi:hypothetical protein